MRKFLCELQFNGKNYFGYQINENAKTVQQELQTALKKLFDKEIVAEGCSRTDSGVSAWQYYFCFCADTKLPADRVAYKLNRFLPKDIQCQNSMEVPVDYNLRKKVKSKTYLYKIYDGEHLQPLLNRDAVFVEGKLDVDQMQDCAKVLLGKHNFKSFCNINADTKTFVRTIFNIQVLKEKNFINILITADGFLYNMCRVIAGTLVECGKGKLNKQDLQNLLSVEDRSKNCAKTMPAKALVLHSVNLQS